MNKIMMIPFFLIILSLACTSTVADKEIKREFDIDQQFKDYWYQGKAELASYELEQARYGQIHDGHAVLIFVTEDFSKQKHVKLDNPSQAGDDAVNVLKLNYTKKFNTGIYPYSMMLSVFKPVQYGDHPHSLKVTASSQEWCGHTFTQLDLRNDSYQGHLYSYFESEGSENELDLDNVLLEDEIYNTIRLDYNLLPTGQIDIIPGLLAQRLMHSTFTVKTATANLETSESGEMVYSIAYNNPQRTLKIFFEDSFPFKITGWEESYQSGFGPGAQTLTTKAVLKETLMTDYWSKNQNEDEYLRKELGLSD